MKKTEDIKKRSFFASGAGDLSERIEAIISGEETRQQNTELREAIRTFVETFEVQHHGEYLFFTVTVQQSVGYPAGEPRGEVLKRLLDLSIK